MGDYDQALHDARDELHSIMSENTLNILGRRRSDMADDVHNALADAMMTDEKVQDWVVLCRWLETNYSTIEGGTGGTWRECLPLQFYCATKLGISPGSYYAALAKLDLCETSQGLMKRPHKKPTRSRFHSGA